MNKAKSLYESGSRAGCVRASIYIHWPYCAKRCSYCNFNKYVWKGAPSQIDQERWKSSFRREISTLLDLSGTREVVSVFFGGGTPSMMAAKTIQALYSTIVKHDALNRKPLEVTLEANPSDIQDKRKVKDFLLAGINRLSIGVQSFDGRDLSRLNRDHNASESYVAIENAAQYFPGAFSLDLIFGLPGQTLNDWKNQLDIALKHPIHHISLYELTLERGTQLWKDVSQGIVELPDEELLAEMYCLAVNSLESIGLKRYEVSNFAKPGFESVHNSWYWLGGEYLGVGPGAHGFFRVRNPENPAANQIAVNELRGKTYARSEVRRGQVQARVQTLEPDSWLRETELLGHGTRKISPLGAEEVLTRILTSSMRTEQGLSEKTCRDLGATLDQLVQHEKCREFIDSKLLIQDPSGIRLSASRIQLADLILPYLLLGCEESSVNEAT